MSSTRAAASRSLPFGLKPYHVVFASWLSAIIVVGTIYSMVNGSHLLNVDKLSNASQLSQSNSMTTSNSLPPIPPQTLLEPNPLHHYWANRKNIVNQMFVKKAWLWTTISWFLQLLLLRSVPGAKINGQAKKQETTQPTQNSNHKQTSTAINPVLISALRWVVATGCWRELFTSWFFGPPLAERIFVATGGACTADGSNGATISSALCRSRATLETKTHPELFADVSLALNGQTTMKAVWRGGHDVSGHTFILVLGALFLLEEMVPFLPHLIPSALANRLFPRSEWAAVNPFVVRMDTRHAVAYFNLGVIALWSWMLLMTALFFHTPQEKITGLLFGLAAWLVLPKGG